MMTYDGSDIYCDLIIPKKIALDVIEETDKVLAYKHTKPHWRIHIVVTPKQHIDSLLDLPAADPELQKELLAVVGRVAKRVNDSEGACRVLTNLGTYQGFKAPTLAHL